MSNLTKALIGKEDHSIQSDELWPATFERLSSTGSTLELRKLPDLWKMRTGGINAKNYGSHTATRATLLAACVAIGTTDIRVIYLDPETWTLTSDLDLSGYSNIYLDFVPGAVIDGAFTLTIDNPSQIIAQPNQQIFGSSITVVFTNGGTVYPEWWYPGTGYWNTYIDKAMACVSSGTVTVYLTQEIYTINSYMTPQSNMILTGNNATIYTEDSTWATQLYNFTLTSNVEIYNLTFDGNRNNNAWVDADGGWPTTREALIITAGSNWKIHNNTFLNAAHGIFIRGTEGTRSSIITNNRFENVRQAIDTYGHGYIISNNIIYGGTDAWYGIVIEGTTDLQVAGTGYDETEPDDSDWTGYDLGYYSLDTLVTGNVIRGENDMLIGIIVDNSTSGCIVANNTVTNCLAKGIQVYDGFTKQLIIANNVVRNIGEVGTYNSAEGIDVINSFTAVNNLLDVLITGNIVEHTTGAGISISKGDRVIVNNNICSYSTGDGYGIKMYYCTGGQVQNNFTFKNTSYGILLDYCQNVILSGNRNVGIGSSTSSGIYFSHAVGNPSNRLGRNWSEGDFTAVSGNVSTNVTEWAMQQFQSSAEPSAGTWDRGALIINNAKTDGAGDSGWVCTASGTFSAATDNTGDTDGSTNVITGMTDTSDFYVGEYVSVSTGFPTTGPYKILVLTSTTMTISANSSGVQSNITVATIDPTFDAI